MVRPLAAATHGLYVEGGRHPLKRFDEALQGCSAQARQRFYAYNFVDLIGNGLAPARRQGLPAAA